jgi:amino acid adenylation domain-containing protein
MASDPPPNGARCIHEMVSEQATRTPDLTAISYQGRTVTYRQLDVGSDRIAQQLRDVGVGLGCVVAVVMERSPELVLTLTAVLKSGGAYLYLDPAEPAEQRARIARDAAARFAVVSSESKQEAPDVERVICLGDLDHPLTAAAPVPASPPEVISPDTPAYVCYTSGSTGEPKGVVVPHRAIYRLVNDPWWISVGPGDVFFQLTRVGFDVSTFEIWTPLVRGCRLALAPPGPVDLEAMVETLRVEGVTVLWLTSGLFHQLATHHLAGLTEVRHLLAGGDVLSPTHVEALLQAHPNLTFTNGYGPTENTTFTTCWTTRSASDQPRVPIGLPIDGTSVAVLDDAMQTVGPGATGELWVSGDGLATGYLNKPVATADRFVANVDPAHPGTRMYRTGDLVRWTEDGLLDFLGRGDRQVKIRGYRVEPSTVEMELLRQPGVEQAAAVTHSDGAGDTRLIAYVAVGDMKPEHWSGFGAVLRERLRESLPAHLVPWAIIALPEIPLNPNGKVDRSSLPETKIARNVWNEYVMPSDSIERRLAAIWSDALDIDRVGVNDNFFELGGHSLMAAELLVALQREFNVSLPARALYLRPTIADLAEELRQREPSESLEGVANATAQ